MRFQKIQFRHNIKPEPRSRAFKRKWSFSPVELCEIQMEPEPVPVVGKIPQDPMNFIRCYDTSLLQLTEFTEFISILSQN